LTASASAFNAGIFSISAALSRTIPAKTPALKPQADAVKISIYFGPTLKGRSPPAAVKQAQAFITRPQGQVQQMELQKKVGCFCHTFFLKSVYMPSSSFADANKDINQRYTIIIGEIVKSYPNYKTNPKFTEYENSYTTNINNLKQLQADIFLLKNELSKNIDRNQQDIAHIDETLFNLEEENKVLRQKLADLNNSDNAAHGMLYDSTTLYRHQLAGNWLLFLSLGTAAYIVFSGKI